MKLGWRVKRCARVGSQHERQVLQGLHDAVAAQGFLRRASWFWAPLMEFARQFQENVLNLHETSVSVRGSTASTEMQSCCFWGAGTLSEAPCWISGMVTPKK